ncbi:MAG: hypothetical protein HY880_01585 [Deltaproteobacteria bacterium]|nr:hypothetical protein [Deltaproteobacteria bacterium]
MKKVIVMGLVVFALAVSGPRNSYAQMCGKMGGMDHKCGCEMKGGMSGMSEHKGMDHGMKGEGMAEMMEHGHMVMKHLMGLDLDEKQKEAIRDIKTRVMKETIKKTAEKQVSKLELKELLGKYSVDLKAVESKLKQIEALRTDLELSHIKALEEVKSHLTDMQKKKMKEIMASGPMMGCDKGCMMQPEAGAQTKPAEHKH